MTGYERYTITPFGSSRPWPVLVDAAAMDQPVVSIGGGAFGVSAHLAPADLVARPGRRGGRGVRGRGRDAAG